MKKIISAAALALLVFGCVQPQNQGFNDPRSVRELEDEVLERAAACGREIERDYEEAIEDNKRKYGSSDKMKAFLIQAAREIKC